MENRKRIAILMGPPALWLIFLFLLPLGIMALYTFRAGTFGQARGVFTLENYAKFLANSAYHRQLLRSTWIVFLVSSCRLYWPTRWPISSRFEPARGR